MESGTPESTGKKSRIDKFAETLICHQKEFLTLSLLTGVDLYREIATRDPLLTPNYILESNQKTPDALIPLLSHSGGLWDAYTTSLLTFYGLQIITGPFGKKVPTNVKVAVASLVGMGAVIANETGIMKGGTSELSDIPSGVLGAMIFSGVMILNKKFIQDCGEAIKKIKMNIKGEKDKIRKTKHLFS